MPALRAFRQIGWSLAGLERALRHHGRAVDADAIAARLAVAWERRRCAAATAGAV